MDASIIKQIPLHDSKPGWARWKRRLRPKRVRPTSFVRAAASSLTKASAPRNDCASVPRSQRRAAAVVHIAHETYSVSARRAPLAKEKKKEREREKKPCTRSSRIAHAFSALCIAARSSKEAFFFFIRCCERALAVSSLLISHDCNALLFLCVCVCAWPIIRGRSVQFRRFAPNRTEKERVVV